MTDALLEQAAGNADVAAQVVRALSEERNLNKKLAGQLKQAEAQLTVALPKAAYFDALVDCPDCTGIRLTAKELGVPQSMFTAYLVRKKYAYYTPPEPEVSTDDAINANPVSVQIGGEWQTFPNTGTAEQAMYEEYRAQTTARLNDILTKLSTLK